MSKKEIKKPATTPPAAPLHDENIMDEQEPDNLDQTDFVNNSSFSFQEADIFPKDEDIKDLLLGKKGDSQGKSSGLHGESGNNESQVKKQPLFPPWLMIIFGGFILLILIIIIAVIIMAAGQKNNRPSSQVDDPSSQTDNQKALDLAEERILAIENLEDTLVLPQTRELIIP